MKKHLQVSGNRRCTSSKILFSAAAVCTAMAVELPSAHAADVSWNVASGLFTTGANWLGGSAPLPADNALISNGGTSTVQIGDSVSVTNLLVNNGSTLTQTGGALNASGTGADPNTAFQIGGVAGQTGTYNVSGASTLTGGRVRIGETGGTGIMTVSGTSTYTGGANMDTWVGNGVGSVGTLSLSNSASWALNNDAIVVGRLGATGTLNMSGTSQVTGNGNQVYLGTDSSTAVATVNMSESSKIAWVGGNFLVGNGGSATLNLQDNALMTTNGEVWLGQGTNGVGVANVSGSAVISSTNNWFVVGRNGGNGTATVSGSGQLLKTGGGEFGIGNGGGATGNLTVKNNGNISSNNTIRVGSEGGNGTLTVQDSATVSSGGEMWIGALNTGSVGVMNIQGGTVTSGSWIAVGRNGSTGTLNISGGTMNKNGAGAVSGTSLTGSNFVANGATGRIATINQTGGTFNNLASVTAIGEGSSNIAVWNASAGTANHADLRLGFGGNGTMNISGTAQVNATKVFVSSNGGSTGTLNLNGGTLTTGRLEKGAGTATVSFNGGVLKASADAPLFLQDFANGDVTIKNGGLKVDTNGFTATMNSHLGGQVGDGGLTKLGAGTLVLNAANTYQGPTVINAGTITVGIAGALSASNLSLNSGTLGLNGFSASQGTLTLLSSSTIDFGAIGANGISFADSSGITWTGTLFLNNFEVGTDTLSFGSVSGLTGAQLAKLSLPGYVATGLNGSGVVQFAAVPEPMNVGLAIGGAMMLLAFQRARSRRQAA